MCFSFLSILQRILLERAYVSSTNFLGVVSGVPQSGGRYGRASVPFCSVPSSVPGWMVSHDSREYLLRGTTWAFS